MHIVNKTSILVIAQNCHTVLQVALMLSFIDSIHAWVIWVALNVVQV